MGVAAAVPIILTGVSTAYGAYSKYQQGQDEARIAEENREFSLMAARDAYIRGQADAGEYRREGSRVVGEQEAALAASGVERKGIVEGTRVLSEMDALQAINNAARAAWGQEVRAQQFADQATQARKRANREVAGTILGGIGSMAVQGYGMYEDWSQTRDTGAKLVGEVWGKGNIAQLPRYGRKPR